jgi:hypothetical protein
LIALENYERNWLSLRKQFMSKFSWQAIDEIEVKSPTQKTAFCFLGNAQNKNQL